MKHGTVTGYTYHACRCDECRKAGSAATKRWAQNNLKKRAEYMKKYKRKYLYGVTEEQFEALEAEYPACAICGSAADKYPQLDHNHSTSQIRGLLCGNCNTGLGLFKESPELLAKASNYLVSWRSPGA